MDTSLFSEHTPNVANNGDHHDYGSDMSDDGDYDMEEVSVNSTDSVSSDVNSIMSVNNSDVDSTDSVNSMTEKKSESQNSDDKNAEQEALLMKQRRSAEQAEQMEADLLREQQALKCALEKSREEYEELTKK